MSAQARAKAIKLLALDVDGVLTDGKIFYSSAGEELKAFNIKDGLGIKMLQRAGITVAIITGRRSAMVERRAQELGITELVQGREDKIVALTAMCERLNISAGECAYMGDDLPDLRAVQWAGLGMTVADGAASVKASAQWVSQTNGGAGAVREACEFILQARGELATIEQAVTGLVDQAK